MNNDNMFVYVDDIPKFEKYDLVNVERLPLHKTRFETSTLYIKGEKYVETKVKSVYFDYLFKDFCDLGKKLYQLAKQNSQILFDSTDIITDDDFESYYIEKEFFNLDLKIKSNELIEEIFDEYYAIKEKTINANEDMLVSNAYSITQNIINSLIFLCDRYKYDIDDYLTKILKMLKNTKENKNYLALLMNINFLYNEVYEIKQKQNLDFKLKKEVSIASKYPTKITIDNYYKEPPLFITFNFSQYEKIKKYIISWVKKYGLPYYPPLNLEEDYKERIKKEIEIKDDEIAIPCEPLIMTSIFSYLLYTIRNDWKKADSYIKSLFKFKEDNKLNDNKKQITKIKEAFSHYCKKTITNLRGFECSYKNIDKINDNNYFKNYDDISQSYQEKIFNNICLASYYIIEDKINLKKQKTQLSTKNKKKQCAICGKWFTPNQNYRTFCSNKCKNEQKRIRETLKKRKKRSYKSEKVKVN